MRWLLAEDRAGRAVRVPVRMPALPPGAPPLAAAIYADMALRWSLRLGAAMPDDRPLPYATTEPVRAGLCEHAKQASRAIHWLEDRGLIWSPGALPPRGKADGTRTFLPGPKPSSALPEATGRVEAAAGVLGTVRVEQPQVEVVEQAGVRDAVAGDRGGLRASAGGAEGGGLIGHGGGSSPGDGRRSDRTAAIGASVEAGR